MPDGVDKDKRLILWLNEVGKNDISLVGGKGANLGELVSILCNLPQGFCITVHAFNLFLKKTGVRSGISDIHSAASDQNLRQKSKTVQNTSGDDLPPAGGFVPSHAKPCILRASPQTPCSQ